MALLKAPFPWHGGKSRVAHIVWPRFGDVLNYVEPFAGSLAVLLARPFPVRTETVNDADTYLSNFWRATVADPEAVAYWADYPVMEADLHARHLWLVNQAEFREKMMVDPEYYDAKIAGWWVWGLSAWIGSGWCATERVDRRSGIRLDGTPERRRQELKRGKGVNADNVANKRPFLQHNGGVGVHRPSIHKKRPLTLKGGTGVGRQSMTRNGRTRPNLRPNQGIEGLPQKIPNMKGNRGVSRQFPYLSGDSGASGAGIHATAFNRKTGGIYDYMEALQARLRRTRVVCGDWKRIMGPSVTFLIGDTAVFLDPPYGDTRQANLYSVDSLTVADEVREWCIEEITYGKPGKKNYFKGPRYTHPKLRIALCGLDGEHNELESLGWDVVVWKANGGYGNQRADGSNDNANRERIWFSPNCLKQDFSGIVDNRIYDDLPLFLGNDQ